MTHRMAEKPPSSGHGKLRGCRVRAAGCGRLPGAKRSAPTVSLQRPLLKKRNIVPQAKEKHFKVPARFQRGGRKRSVDRRGSESVTSQHSSPPPRSSVVGRRHFWGKRVYHGLHNTDFIKVCS